MAEEKMYLSEKIQYDKDIEPYQFIKIYAGVGSGKNTLIDNLIKGNVIKNSDNTTIDKKYVLLITSRRAKSDEQLSQEDVVYDPAIGEIDLFTGSPLVTENPKYEYYFESPTMYLPDLDGWGNRRIYKRSVVNTNAKIEHYLKRFKLYDAYTHPWLRFDLIIVDEVHSIVTDASYQSSPFYVRRLIEEALKNNQQCKVIAMTGSPEALKEHKLFEKAHTINKMEECHNVTPKKIRIITSAEATELQCEMLNSNKKFVAFYNHINSIIAMYSKYPEKVLMSYSDESRLKRFEKDNKDEYERMQKSLNKLSETKLLPEEINAFLTTSRNKEGININNKDIKVMFVESHIGVDIVQMAGRIRNAVDILYIVDDVEGFRNTDSKFESEFSKRDDVLRVINQSFQEHCEKSDYNILETDPAENTIQKSISCYPEIMEYIDYIHNKYPYIRFDYFTYKFVYYSEREMSKSFNLAETQKYKQARKNEKGLKALVNEWFPDVECEVSENIDFYEEIKVCVKQYLVDNDWLNRQRVIQHKQLEIIYDELIKITGSKLKRLKSLLKHYGYDLLPLTATKNKYAKYEIVPLR